MAGKVLGKLDGGVQRSVMVDLAASPACGIVIRKLLRKFEAKVRAGGHCLARQGPSLGQVFGV